MPLKKPRTTTILSVSLHFKEEILSYDQILAILPLKEGDSYTPETLEKAKSDLLKTNLFVTVEIETKRRGNKVHLDYFLQEARIIRKVSVSGNYPFLSKKIYRLSALQPGNPFQPDLIPESEERIKLFFEKEGYFGTQVIIKPMLDPKLYKVNLEIDVDKGKTHHLGQVTVEGNHFFQDSFFKNKLFSFVRFRLTKAKKAIKKLEKLYHEKGFVRARVKLISSELNAITKRVDVHIRVQERKRLHLRFRGNRWFSPQTLDDFVTFYKERGYGRFAIKRSIERLLDFYHFNGFLKTQIEADTHQNDENVFITFHLTEGPRTRLKAVKFHGNTQMRNGPLIDAMLSKKHTLTQQGLFKEEFIPIDIKRIENFYHQEGFFDAIISDWETRLNIYGDQTTLVINIEEGKAYEINSIQIVGNELLSDREILHKANLKINKAYQEKKIDRAKDKLINFYQKKGYAHIDIQIEQIRNPETHQVSLVINIDKGPLVHFGQIIVHGQYNTNEDTIRSALKIKTGDRYHPKRILDAQLNLKKLGIFDHVRVTPHGFDKKRPEIDIIVKVQERKSITFDIQAGFDSDKLASGQLLFTKRNLLGRAHQLQLRGVGGIELSRGEITLYSPRIFGASWNLVNQLFVEHIDDENFNANSFGGSIGVLKNFGPDWTVLFKGEITRFNILEDQSNRLALERNLFDNTFAEFAASVAYDTRDHFADPQSGFYTVATTELDIDLANISNNFNISQFNISHYFSIFSRLTFVNTLRIGKLFLINQNSQIPANKLFFLGGNDTIRGFDEDAVNSSGGTTSIIYNAELHFRIFNAFKLAGFFDLGSLTQTFSQISKNSFREAAGFGLRYITPVGPIRLDYGFVLDKRSNEKGQRFHFSFGYFF